MKNKFRILMISAMFLLLLGLIAGCGKQTAVNTEKTSNIETLETEKKTEENTKTNDKTEDMTSDSQTEKTTNEENSNLSTEETAETEKQTESTEMTSETIEEVTSVESSEASTEATTDAAPSETEESNVNAKKYSAETPVEEILASLTTEEKVRLLFITSTADYRAMPCAGTIYFENDIANESQLRSALSSDDQRSYDAFGLPAFLCVDEEGGRVARIGNAAAFSVPKFENMAIYGQTGSPDTALAIGGTIGSYLKNLGFNVDFAPVADVLSNPQNTVVATRSFGADATVVSLMCAGVSDGLLSQGVLSCYKHFPGHGQTEGDTHLGFAYTNKTLDEMRECELLPFQEAASKNVPFIMVSHISCPAVTGDETPAVLSPVLVDGVLRNELGYQGVIITDGMNMGAIKNHYGSADAAVRAILAGCDIVLLPANYGEAYQGVLTAVQNGTISMDRLNASVRRIIALKKQLM